MSLSTKKHINIDKLDKNESNLPINSLNHQQKLKKHTLISQK